MKSLKELNHTRSYLKNISLSIGLIISMSSVAQAQEHVGNGGDVMLCTPPGGAETAQFYDIYESPSNHRAPDFDFTQKFDAAMDQLLSRLKRVDPIRFQRYTQKYKSSTDSKKVVNEYAQFIEDFRIISQMIEAGENDPFKINPFLKVTHLDPNDLPDVKDEGLISLPPRSCDLKQLVIQTKTIDPLGVRGYFWVHFPTLKKIPAAERADVVMHELIYRDAAAAGYFDSRYARYVNQLILADVSRYEYISQILERDQAAKANKLPELKYFNPTTSTLGVSAAQVTGISGSANGKYVVLEEVGAKSVMSQTLDQLIAEVLMRHDYSPQARRDEEGPLFGMLFTVDAVSLLHPITASIFGAASVYVIFEAFSRERMELDQAKLFVRYKNLHAYQLIPSGTTLDSATEGYGDNNRYIFDVKGNLRYVVDPQLEKMKYKGKMSTGLASVVELDTSGNVINQGNTADFNSMIDKLSAE